MSSCALTFILVRFEQFFIQFFVGRTHVAGDGPKIGESL